MSNKQQLLTKRVVKVGVTAFVLVAVVGSLYGGLSYYADTLAQEKNEANGRLNQDQTLSTTLRNQLNKSGEAQKSYSALQEQRTSMEFASNLADLKDFLRASKSQFHFDKINFKPQKEALTDKPELQNFNYDIFVQPRMSLQLQAVSDVHLFSFVHALENSAPGLIRVDALKVKRLSDMSEAVISQMQTGAAPLLIDATIEFTWIRLATKSAKDQKTNTGTPPAN